MLTVGLVGCGNWGRNILRDLVSLGCQVTVADIASAVRERVLGEGASRSVPDAASLPDCDGYVVAVPIPLLAEISGRLLERGRPVFSEKTLCLSLESADWLASKGGDTRLFAMHKWRYHPGIDALRCLIETRQIGRLKEIRLTRHAWVPDLHGGDVFWTLAVHDLTIVKHLLGCVPQASRAWVTPEDSLPVSLLAVLDGEVRVTLSACARHPVRQSAVSIHGSEASAALPDAYAPAVLFTSRLGSEEIPVDTTFPLYLELKEFVDHLRGGPPPRCSLQEAREMTAALIDLRRAAGITG